MGGARIVRVRNRFEYRRVLLCPGFADALLLMKGFRMTGNCVRCGNVAELDVIDFGPFIDKAVCDDCWDAENERAWAAVDR